MGDSIGATPSVDFLRPGTGSEKAVYGRLESPVFRLVDACYPLLASRPDHNV